MRKLPLIIFLMLLVMTVSSSIVSYNRTRQMLKADLHQALLLTIKDRGFERMKRDSIKACHLLTSSAYVATRETPDEILTSRSLLSPLTPSSVETNVLTIADPIFQQHIKTEALRPKAYIAYHITPHNDDYDVRMEGQADFSMAFVWSMSDQRLSLLLCLGTFLSLLISVKRRVTANEKHQMIAMHLTPMQEQLMDMFMNAPQHRLTKQEICDALWPDKDNAAETLYTTIRRLRNELHASSDWEIESERGKSYELKRRQHT